MFIITGYPRSRTAWFSEWFTQGGVKCYHDKLRFHTDPKNCLETLGESSGDSDSGWLFFPKLLKGKKVVVIERDISEVEQSLKYIAPHLTTENSLNILQEYYSTFLKELQPLVIPFSEINNRLEEVWTYCTDTPFDVKYSEGFANVNVQNNYLTGE